jgi:hypothetical protein
MSKGNHFSFALVDKPGAVDVEKGVIFGVAVITEGPARGHFDWDSGKPLYADADTLKEVMACAKTYAGGLKVKMNHGSGVGDIVGRLDNFRIDATVLRADFFALSASSLRGYIFEIATTLPDAFGLSISFSGTPKVDDKRAYARCTEIYSADFVDEPAANPTGLFQRGAGNGAAQPKQPNSKTNMEDDKKPDPIADLSASVASLIARLEKLEAVNSGEGDKKESSEEAMAALAEKTALAALKEYTKQFGAPPAAPSGETKREEKKPEKNFEAVVAEKAVELKSKAAAIKWAVTAHPELHKAYLSRLSAGEVINL